MYKRAYVWVLVRITNAVLSSVLDMRNYIILTESEQSITMELQRQRIRDWNRIERGNTARVAKHSKAPPLNIVCHLRAGA